MKRFIVFLFIALLLCGINLHYVDKLSFKDIFSGCNAEVYLPSVIDVDYESVNNGDGLIIFCKFEDVFKIKNTYKINGYTIKLIGESIEKIILQLKPNFIIKKEKFVYGYLNCVEGCVGNGKGDLNFQCARVGNEIHIGFPLLLGSY